MKLNLTRTLAFIDLETTGTNVVTDRIVEICILKVNTDNSTEIITQRINPTIPIPYATTVIHGITDEDVKDCPVFKTIAKSLEQFIGGSDIAGYNSNKFDVPMLIEEFLRAGIDFDVKSRRLVDVQNIFHKMEPRNLSAAFKFYCNKEHVNAHSAEADTVATYEILKSQIERYNDVEYADRDGNVCTPIKNDVQALYEFSFNAKNVDLVGHIVYDDKNVEVFNFGKHKGKPVEFVFSKESSYYDWMMKSDFPLSTKKVITAIKLRGFNKTSVKLNS